MSQDLEKVLFKDLAQLIEQGKQQAELPPKKELEEKLHSLFLEAKERIENRKMRGE